MRTDTLSKRLSEQRLCPPSAASTLVEDSRSLSRAVPLCAQQVLTAALILAIGSSLGGGVLFLLGVPLTVIAFILACRAAFNWSNPGWTADLSTVTAGLAAMAALGFVAPATGGLLWYEILKRVYASAAIVLVGIFSIGDRALQRRVTWILVWAAVVLFALGPIGAPNPSIDVFAWTQTAVHALLHRVNPYTVVAPDVYRGRYDPGYTVSVYPYMPATLLVYAPWIAVLGDFRYALAASLALSFGLIHRVGRRLGVDPQFACASVLAIALHPSGPRMIESGWTEPLLLVGAALFVYLAVENPGGVGQAIAFLLLPALKQYVVAPVLLYLAHARRVHVRPRAMVAGLSIGAATVLPFLFWNWRATLSGIVFQMSAPTVPRLRSTSLIALIAMTGSAYPGRWFSAVVQLIVGSIAWWRLKDHGLSGLLLASALSLFATFLVGWQAFVNYYYFIGALLILAALVRAAQGPGPSERLSGRLGRLAALPLRRVRGGVMSKMLRRRPEARSSPSPGSCRGNQFEQ